MDYTRTASWLDGGRYTTTQPSARLRGLLESHHMTVDTWRAKFDRVAFS
jgi:hypothetical protein